MKKIISFIYILIVLCILAWPFAGKQYDLLQQAGVTDFRNIKILKTDDKGTMYLVIDNGYSEEIVTADKYGEVLKRIQIEPSAPTFQSVIRDLYIDRDQNIYVNHIEFAVDGDEDFYALITRIDNDGYDSRLVLRKKIGSGKDRESFIFSAFSEDTDNIYGGWVYNRRASVFRMPHSHESKVTAIYDYDIGSLPDVREMAALPGGNIVISSITGYLYSGDTSGYIQKLYPKEGQDAIATDLCHSGENGVFFYDAYAGKYMKSTLGKETQLVADSSMQLNTEYGIVLTDLIKISASPGGRVAAVIHNGEGYRLVNGGFSYVSVIEGLTEKMNNKPLIAIIEIAAIVLLLTVLIWDFYCKVMKMRMSIILKQCMGLLFAILIIMISLITVMSENLVANVLYDEYKSHLTDASFIFANQAVKQEVLGSFNTPSDTADESYMALKNLAGNNGLMDTAEYDAYAKDMYFNIYKKNGDTPVFAFSSGGVPVAFPLNRLLLDSDREDAINRAFEDRVTGFGIDTYSHGRWMYMATPLVINGSFYGVLENGISMEDFTNHYDTLTNTFTYAVLLIAAVILIIIISTIISSLISIRKLSRGVDRIAAGQFDVRVTVKSGDEIEYLSRKFNDMASFIENYTRKLARLNESYYRFIPERFINMLGVRSIESVEKGDHVQEDMAVMHFNVRSFFDLTSDMKSEDIFKFINGVFERFSPVVQGFNGIIDRFMDTGFTAVFTDSPESSLNAALRIQEKLSAWNMERTRQGLPKVSIGITLHFGRIMLGVIGDGARLSSAAVSQCVHTSVRLEEYGDKSNVSILSTGEIVNNLPSGIFKKRYLGTVRDSGSDVEIYDCFEGDEYSVRERKEQTLESFDRGVVYFQKGDYYKARASFIDVLKVLPEDGVSKRYLNLSDLYYRNESAGSKYFVV